MGLAERFALKHSLDHGTTVRLAELLQAQIDRVLEKIAEENNEQEEEEEDL